MPSWCAPASRSSQLRTREKDLEQVFLELTSVGGVRDTIQTGVRDHVG